MLAANPPHRAARSPHHHAFGGENRLSVRLAAALDPAQQRAVGHAGGRENAVALGEVFELVDAIEVGDAPLAGAGLFVLVAEHQPAVELPADAAQRSRREHAFGRAALAHVHIDRGVFIGHRDDARDVAVTDQHHAAAQGTQLGNQLGMARTIKHADIDVGRLHALGSGHRHDVLGRGLGEIDDALGIARANRELVHIDVGRVQEAALFRRRQHGERVRPGLGGNRGALERIKRDVDLGAFAHADLFADEQHRGFVALALADHHGAIDVEVVEGLAHRRHGRRVSRLFITPPDQLRRRNRGGFGNAHHLQHQHALDGIVGSGLCSGGMIGIGRRVHVQFSPLSFWCPRGAGPDLGLTRRISGWRRVCRAMPRVSCRVFLECFRQ